MKFNHFRHSVSARNDDKIVEFSRLLGRKSKEGYFYYFTLIELCSSESEEGQTVFKIHHDTLRTLWSCNTLHVRNVCALIAQSTLAGCSESAHHVVFHIPNLPNYLGSYVTKERKGKQKEKKGKETSLAAAEFKTENVSSNFISSQDECEIIEAPKKNLPGEKIQGNLKVDQVEELFNQMLAGQGNIKFCRMLSGEDRKNLLQTIAFPQFSKLENWKELFEIVKSSPFLMGQNGSNFVATLNWLSISNNASKVLNGQYSGLNKLSPKNSDPRNPTNNPYTAIRLKAEENGEIA